MRFAVAEGATGETGISDRPYPIPVSRNPTTTPPLLMRAPARAEPGPQTLLRAQRVKTTVPSVHPVAAAIGPERR